MFALNKRVFKPATKLAAAVVIVAQLSACATVGGAAIGAGIGALAGDAETGMAVGATTGAVIDIFGR